MSKPSPMGAIMACLMAGAGGVAAAADAAASGTTTTARSPGPAAEVPPGARTQSRTAVGAPGTMAGAPGETPAGSVPPPQTNAPSTDGQDDEADAPDKATPPAVPPR